MKERGPRLHSHVCPAVTPSHSRALAPPPSRPRAEGDHTDVTRFSNVSPSGGATCSPLCAPLRACGGAPEFTETRPHSRPILTPSGTPGPGRPGKPGPRLGRCRPAHPLAEPHRGGAAGARSGSVSGGHRSEPPRRARPRPRSPSRAAQTERRSSGSPGGGRAGRSAAWADVGRGCDAAQGAPGPSPPPPAPTPAQTEVFPHPQAREGPAARHPLGGLGLAPPAPLPAVRRAVPHGSRCT